MFFYKKLFLILTHYNDLKTKKKEFEVKKKIKKKLFFFKKHFKNIKINMAEIICGMNGGIAGNPFQVSFQLAHVL
jgi:hypothetical protein